MMKRIIIIVLLMSTSLLGCKQDPNGTYLVYKTETPPDLGLGEPGHDFQASAKLRQMFKGRKLSIEFKPNYVILNEEDSSEDLILDKVEDESPDREQYQLVYTKNLERVELTIFRYKTEQEVKISLSVVIYQLEEDPRGQLRNGRYASALCSLDKQTDKESSDLNIPNGEDLFPQKKQQSTKVQEGYYVPEDMPPIRSDVSDSTVLDTTIGSY